MARLTPLSRVKRSKRSRAAQSGDSVGLPAQGDDATGPRCRAGRHLTKNCRRAAGERFLVLTVTMDNELFERISRRIVVGVK